MAQAIFDRRQDFDRRQVLTTIGALAVAQSVAGPAHAQTKNYLVFFDYGLSTAGKGAKELLDALKPSLRPNSQVTLTGHCDSSEPDPDKLGLNRAVTVLATWAATGVPAGVKFAVSSKAGSELMVKTGPNTREPQNRRVIITIA